MKKLTAHGFGLHLCFILASITAIGALATACGSPAAPGRLAGQSSTSTPTAEQLTATPTTPAVPRLQVVATTTVLADLVRNVGGDKVEVRSLVPPGADVHAYQATPQDSMAIGQATVIVSNGSGLDDFLNPLLASARQAGSLHIVAAEGLEAVPLEELGFPGEHANLIEEIERIIHQVEDGEIPSTDGLVLIERLLEADHRDHDAAASGHAHEEEELLALVDRIIHGAEDGRLSAADAVTQIEALAEHYQDACLGRELDEAIHHAEEEGLDPEEILELLDGLVHGYEIASLENRLLALIHDVEEGKLSPSEAIEEMEELIDSYGREHGHAHDSGDPHFWQDPVLTIRYVEQIRDGLIQSDPQHAAVYEANADAYIQQLRDLDQEIARILRDVPVQRRHLVTFHDAYGYFARRYGWRISAFVPSDASDVTPAAVVRIMTAIREEGIPAVFAEPQFSSSVLEQAARDAGVEVGTIYSDTVDDNVPTYIDMMRFNARSLAEHLR